MHGHVPRGRASLCVGAHLWSVTQAADIRACKPVCVELTHCHTWFTRPGVFHNGRSVHDSGRKILQLEALGRRVIWKDHLRGVGSTGLHALLCPDSMKLKVFSLFFAHAQNNSELKEPLVRLTPLPSPRSLLLPGPGGIRTLRTELPPWPLASHAPVLSACLTFHAILTPKPPFKGPEHQDIK